MRVTVADGARLESTFAFGIGEAPRGELHTEAVRPTNQPRRGATFR
jgi:hypothetical protein